ncbi:MAG: GAF domain-containing protein [Ramlibacter sp.]|nr:GAF domain-containing protein [Ramlibacter sp.]
MSATWMPASENPWTQPPDLEVVACEPHQERFDRVTRTLSRALQVPAAVMTLGHRDHQWCSSMLGTHGPADLQDLSFCSHVVAQGRAVAVSDTSADEEFADFPLVLGKTVIRACVGVPILLAPGMVAGSLCAMDSMPRCFGDDEVAALRDLARMAETELQAAAQAGLRNSLLTWIGLAQRQVAIDPATGCSTIRCLRALLDGVVEQAREGHLQMALCLLHVDFHRAAVQLADKAGDRSLFLKLARLMHHRLPAEAAMARLGDCDFCALLLAPTAASLDYALEPVVQPQLSAVLDDGAVLHGHVSSHVMRLADVGEAATGNLFWARTLSAFAPVHGIADRGARPH